MRRYRLMRLASLTFAIVLATISAPLAQDFLAPLRNAMEEVLPRESPAPRPAPPPERDEPADVEDSPDRARLPPLPRPRPDNDGDEAAGEDGAETEAPPAGHIESRADEERIYQAACPALLTGLVVGEMLAPIAEGACGERSPLRISAVSANGRMVPLSNPVTTNCAMAGALAGWVAELDAYAGAALDAPLAEVSTGTGMMCRNRAGAGNGFMSEHGFANALDITGFTLADGRAISVEKNWLPASSPGGRLLRHAHGAACGRFTTVLGPEANADHHDHLHVDLGCHGQTCTARICE